MRPSDYLPTDTPALNLAIVERAHDDIGEGEDIGADGRGTNRSTYVDHVNSRFGSPLGSYWCANDVGGWWEDAGADIPPENVGEADAWRRWALATGRFAHDPKPGYAVLYGTPTHADHITVVARIVPDPTAPHGRQRHPRLGLECRGRERFHACAPGEAIGGVHDVSSCQSCGSSSQRKAPRMIGTTTPITMRARSPRRTLRKAFMGAARARRSR
jgi:hypothetical protein